MRQLFPLCIGLLCIALSTTSCKKDDANAVRIVLEEYTIEDQKSIGDNLAEFVKTNPTSYDVLNANAYSDASDYLNTIFRSAVLTEQIVLREEFDWELIPIIDNEEAYAYTIPGGKMVLSTGMLHFLNDESELLALIAHEIYYTDIDRLTASLGDEFGGVRMGNVALGTDTDPNDIIEYLKDLIPLKVDVLAADMHTLDLMCPFNYDISSIESLVMRAQNDPMAERWSTLRPRNETWTTEINDRSNTCATPNGERFKSRYDGIKAMLPN